MAPICLTSGSSIQKSIAVAEFSLPSLSSLLWLSIDRHSLHRATEKETRTFGSRTNCISVIGRHRSAAGYRIAVSTWLSGAGEACGSENERGDRRRPLRAGNASRHGYFLLSGASATRQFGGSFSEAEAS